MKKELEIIITAVSLMLVGSCITGCDSYKVKLSPDPRQFMIYLDDTNYMQNSQLAADYDCFAVSAKDL